MAVGGNPLRASSLTAGFPPKHRRREQACVAYSRRGHSIYSMSPIEDFICCGSVLSTLRRPALDVDSLEEIQRLASRFVNGFHRLSYEERLRRLGLHPLRRRRLRGDLIVVYKMFFERLDPEPQPLFYSASAAWLERSPPFKLLQDHSRGLRYILEQASHFYCQLIQAPNQFDME